jgi:hypothetical protein
VRSSGQSRIGVEEQVHVPAPLLNEMLPNGHQPRTAVHCRLFCEGFSVLPKKERFQIFLRRLKSAKCAASAEEALQLLSTILNDVEDEFSDIPQNPLSWQDDDECIHRGKIIVAKCLDSPLSGDTGARGTTRSSA